MTPDALSSGDAIVQAGLDWTVALLELETTDGMEMFIKLPFATVRDTDKSVLVLWVIDTHLFKT